MSRQFSYLLFSSPHDLTNRRTRFSTTGELCHEALAGDELMVQGIDYTSVSPFLRTHTAMGLVSVVHIFLDALSYPYCNIIQLRYFLI